MAYFLFVDLPFAHFIDIWGYFTDFFLVYFPRVLLFLECQTNWPYNMLKFVSFCFFNLVWCFWDLFMFLHLLAVWSFLLLNSVEFYRCSTVSWWIIHDRYLDWFGIFDEYKQTVTNICVQVFGRVCVIFYLLRNT